MREWPLTTASSVYNMSPRNKDLSRPSGAPDTKARPVKNGRSVLEAQPKLYLSLGIGHEQNVGDILFSSQILEQVAEMSTLITMYQFGTCGFY